MKKKIFKTLAKIMSLQLKKATRSIEEIKKELANSYPCYVLITCESPSEKGEMKVELSYEGDKTLAGFLLENAQDVFHSEAEESSNSC